MASTTDIDDLSLDEISKEVLALFQPTPFLELSRRRIPQGRSIQFPVTLFDPLPEVRRGE